MHLVFPEYPKCSEMGNTQCFLGVPCAQKWVYQELLWELCLLPLPAGPSLWAPFPRKASSAEPCPAHLVGISASSGRCVHTEPHLLLAEIGFGVGPTYPGNEQLMGRQKPACSST